MFMSITTVNLYSLTQIHEASLLDLARHNLNTQDSVSLNDEDGYIIHSF